MLAFGTGASTAASGAVAAREAAHLARETAGAAPKLAIAFVSPNYGDLDEIHGVLVEVLGDVPIIGGTSGGAVFASATGTCAQRGVSVIVVGGTDIEVVVESTAIDGGLLSVVPAADRIRRAADAAGERGFKHYTCLVFAPGIHTDGDAFVAAVRKGAGERAVLAGGLVGDDLLLDAPKVFAKGALLPDHAIVAGLFTKNEVAVTSRHGGRPIGPVRTVTRSEGVDLHALDERPALEVWLEDARRAGIAPPTDPADLGHYLVQHHSIGILVEGAGRARRKSSEAIDEARELVVRTPHAILENGAVRLTAAIAEGTRVRLLQFHREDLLAAADDAAVGARAASGTGVAGALVLSCASRWMALGDRFCEEPEVIAHRLGAPIAGTCVYGEIARNIRDVDAFFNTTAVVIAFRR